MIKIPSQNKQFAQTNQSDRLGTIYRTKNISFDEQGYITLSEPTKMVANNIDSANLQNFGGIGLTSSAFARQNLWIGGNKNIFLAETEGPSFYPSFKQDTEGGTPEATGTRFLDMVTWNNDLYVARGLSVTKWNGSVWSTFSSESTDGFALAVFTNLNQLALAYLDKVQLFDSSGNLVQTLNIPDDLEITGIRWNSTRLYVSTKSKNNTNSCVILEWDGLTNQANTGYRVNSNGVFGLAAYQQGVAFVTQEGELGYCYGGVQPLAFLPPYFSKNKWSSRIFPIGNRIGQNSIIADKEKIYIAVSGDSDYSIEKNTPYITPEFPSGVWCYDPAVGLYHKFSVGASKCFKTDAIATSSVNTTTNIITVAGATVPETGTPCFYHENAFLLGTTIGGISQGIRYFVIKESDTTLKLALTRTNALAGTAINLTSTGNNDQFITFHEEKDFGGIGNYPSHVNKISNFETRRYGAWGLDTFVIGGSYRLGTSNFQTSFSAVQKYQENRGYIVTPKIESAGLTDNITSLTLKWSKLKDESDKIIVKYRNKDSDLTEYITGTRTYFTLTANNQYTTTEDISDVRVGDEVEIVQGVGAGYLAHITAITETGGTYTVTLDEAIRNSSVGDTGLALYQRWTKENVIDSNSPENDVGYKTITLNKQSKWTQFKIELRGIETKLEEIIINNETNRPIRG